VYNEFLAGTLVLEGADVEVSITTTYEGVSATATRTLVLSFAGTG